MMADGMAKGAFILMTAGVISKLLGAVYRIPLARIIGAEGIGLYEMAYPIYSLLLIMAVSGVPIAVSKLVSEKLAEQRYHESYRVFIIALVFLFLTGSFFSYLMHILAEPISYKILGDHRVVYSLRAISPAILLVSLMAAFRGYFQGLQIMTPTAISQVVEQFIRVITMLVLAYVLIERGTAYGAAGATFGAVTGALAGFMVVLVMMFVYKRINKLTNLLRAIFGTFNLAKSIPLILRLLSIAIPVSLGALIIPVMQTVDAVIIPQRLQIAGFSSIEATHLYGLLAGMALRLVSLPTTFSLALGASLVPALSESSALKLKNRIKVQLTKAFRLTMLFAVPSSVGLLIMSERLTLLLFDYPEAGEPLQFLALGTLFLSFQQVSAFALQGIGHQLLPVKNLCYGGFVNFLFNYYLTAIPEIGINGGAIGTCAGFLVASLFNLRDIKTKAGTSQTLIQMAKKPVMAAVLMGSIILYFQPILDHLVVSTNLATLFGIALGIVSYSLLIITIGGLTEEDIESIPKIGPNLVSFIKKLGLWRG